MKRFLAVILVPVFLFAYFHAEGKRSYAGPSPENTLSAYLGSIRVEAPERYRGLTLFPLTTSRPDFTPYVPLSQALARGQVQVRELAGGEVNRIEIRNVGGAYVFALSGEILEGAKQDRILEQDLLLAPKTDWITVNAFCTERGRWTPGERDFKSSRYVIPNETRKAAKIMARQDVVWDSVAANEGRLAVPAPTSAAKETYQAPHVKEEMKEYETRFKGLPMFRKQVIGVAAARGGQLLVIDLFQNPDLFRSLYPKLLQSYVADVLRHPWSGEISRNEIQRILNRAASSSLEALSTPGAGEAYRLRETLLGGTALLFEDHVVHLDLFPAEDNIQPLKRPEPGLDLRYRREQHTPR